MENEIRRSVNWERVKLYPSVLLGSAAVTLLSDPIIAAIVALLVFVDWQFTGVILKIRKKFWFLTVWFYTSFFSLNGISMIVRLTKHGELTFLSELQAFLIFILITAASVGSIYNYAFKNPDKFIEKN